MSNKNIDVAVAQELFKYFPNSINVKYNHVIDEFENKLYKTHLFQTGKLKTCTAKYRHLAIHVDYSRKQLLWQIFIFSLPNWETLWFQLGLPASFELQKRLRFCKEIDKWVPDAKSLTGIFMDHFD